MILGIGIDLVDIGRIRAALENPRTGNRFRERVFTVGEIDYCERRRQRFESYAARFAAKEAMIKALGCACDWRDIEVVREDAAPLLQLHGRTAERAAARGIARVHLSLSHSESHATAFVVAESA